MRKKMILWTLLCFMIMGFGFSQNKVQVSAGTEYSWPEYYEMTKENEVKATLRYIDMDTGEVIKESKVDWEIEGTLYTVRPTDSFTTEEGEVYVHDYMHRGNSLDIEVPAEEYDKNIVTMYYYNVNRDIGCKKASVILRHMNGEELLEEERIDNLRVGSSYSCTSPKRITKDERTYIFKGYNCGKMNLEVLQEDESQNIITLQYYDSEIIGMGSGVTIALRDSATGEFLNVKHISSVGGSYTYEPQNVITTKRYGTYVFDSENGGNKLETPIVCQYCYNTITAYYRKMDINTSSIIEYRDADTKEIIKTEIIDGLKEGCKYTHIPTASFPIDYVMSYVYDSANTGNVLNVDVLRTNSSENVITVYYKKTFQPYDINKTMVEIKKTTYTGKKLSPSLKVTYMYGDKTKKLVKNQDYTVTFKNAKNIGTATAIIKGIGNCTGTKQVTFTIQPKANKIKRLKSKNGKLTVKFTKSKGATGYEVLCATNTQFKSAKKKTTKRTTLTWKGLEEGKTYYVKVRAYKKVKGKKIYSTYSAVKKVK